MKRRLLLLIASVAFVAGPAISVGSAAVAGTPSSRIEREVRHELVMLPYYSVFDDLALEVNGGTVVLTGKVTKPVLKDDAERVVKRIEGVERVENRIQVLPLS